MKCFFGALIPEAELDLFWQEKGKNWGAEFKYADAPKMSKSMESAIHDLKLSHLWVVYPGKEKYALREKVDCCSLHQTFPGTYAFFL